MKKSLLVILSILITTYSHAQKALIPDPNFRNFIQSQYPSCIIGDSIITNCNEIVTEDFVDVRSMGISDLTGISYFSGLYFLMCDSNNLSFLPSLPVSLNYLSCSSNSLTALPDLNYIMDLNCSQNQIQALPPLPNFMNSLIINNNQISSINRFPDYIPYINCSNNNLSTLPTFVYRNYLNYLDCSNNALDSLPYLPCDLIILKCSGNKISCIPNIPTCSTATFSIPPGLNNCCIKKPKIFINNITLTTDVSTNGMGSSAGWYLNDTLINNTSTILALRDGIYKVISSDSGLCIPNNEINFEGISFNGGGKLVAPVINGGVYKWYLDNNLIANADSNIYYAQIAGLYKVVITFDPSIQLIKTNLINSLTTATYSKSVPDITSVHFNSIQKKELNVFPVPSNKDLFIENNENNTDYEIYNVNGIKISYGILTGSTLEISQMPNGIYFLILGKDTSAKKAVFIKN